MTADTLSEIVQHRHADVLGGQPVIDSAALEALSELADGDEAFVNEVIDMFMEDAVQRMQSMESAVAQADWESAAKVAHALKSASANVGALPFSEACGQFENSARDGKAGDMPDHATHLMGMFTDVQQVLARLQSRLCA